MVGRAEANVHLDAVCTPARARLGRDVNVAARDGEAARHIIPHSIGVARAEAGAETKRDACEHLGGVSVELEPDLVARVSDRALGLSFKLAAGLDVGGRKVVERLRVQGAAHRKLRREDLVRALDRLFVREVVGAGPGDDLVRAQDRVRVRDRVRIRAKGYKC